jgi:hypothetical protein
LVAEMVREATGRPVAVDAHTKQTMAMGAAYVAEQRRATAAAATAVAGVAVPAQAADAPPEVVAEPGPEPDTEAGPPRAAPEGIRSRRMLPVGMALVAALVVAAVAIGANMLSGSGVGAGPSSSVAPSLAVVPSASPSASTSPSPSPSPTPVPTPTPTPAPTPTPTPSGLAANIKGITVSGGRYVVDYEVFDITQDNDPHNGTHVHFFYNTVKPQNAGTPGRGPWELYDGPIPFRVYKVADKPRGATKICVLVARKDHSVIQDTGNCVAIPS